MSLPSSIYLFISTIKVGTLALSGCAPSTKFVDASFRDTDFPEIGVAVTAEVGDRLIEQSMKSNIAEQL